MTAPPAGAREDVGHTERERRRAAGPEEERLLADVGSELRHGRGGYGKAPLRDRGGGRCRSRAHNAGWRVHGKVNAGLQDASRDHRHDGHEALHQHRAIAHWNGVRLLGNHLGCGPRRDQRMKSGDRAAGDSDEAEREDLPGEDGARAVDEASKGRELQLGMHNHNADREHEYHTELHEGAEIVARGRAAAQTGSALARNP